MVATVSVVALAADCVGTPAGASANGCVAPTGRPIVATGEDPAGDPARGFEPASPLHAVATGTSTGGGAADCPGRAGTATGVGPHAYTAPPMPYEVGTAVVIP